MNNWNKDISHFRALCRKLIRLFCLWYEIYRGLVGKFVLGMLLILRRLLIYWKIRNLLLRKKILGFWILWALPVAELVLSWFHSWIMTCSAGLTKVTVRTAQNKTTKTTYFINIIQNNSFHPSTQTNKTANKSNNSPISN